eukprot:2751654-Alexandrium_andersonii.AAC.1
MAVAGGRMPVVGDVCSHQGRRRLGPPLSSRGLSPAGLRRRGRGSKRWERRRRDGFAGQRLCAREGRGFARV